MERLSEGAIELNDDEVFHNCSYSCYVNLADALFKLQEYEDLEKLKYNPKSTKEITINYLDSILANRLNAKILCKDKHSQGYFHLNDECLLLQQVISIVKESEGE